MSRRADVLREHVDALTEFERDYRAYVETQMASNQGRSGPRDPSELPALRSKLVRKVSRAGRAFDASGVQIAITPPPMFGGPVLTSLASQAFAHETGTFGTGGDRFEAARIVLDGLGTAIGALEDNLDQEAKKASQRSAAGRTVESARNHLPTLWGRVRALPRWMATAADAITVGGFAVGIVTKIAGLW